MTTFVGFHGPIPFSIIFWQLDGEDQSKTICYSLGEEVQAIERLHTGGDFYNQYDKAMAFRSDDTIAVYCKEILKGA